MSNYQKRNECAVCENTSLQEVLNLNEVPLAGYFPTKKQLEEKDNQLEEQKKEITHWQQEYTKKNDEFR